MKTRKLNIDQFFQALKKLPENVNINEVHQLIQHPEALARPQGKHLLNPLKITIMTTTIAILVGTIAFWPSNPVENLISIPPQKEKEISIKAPKTIAPGFQETKTPDKKLETSKPLQPTTVEQPNTPLTTASSKKLPADSGEQIDALALKSNEYSAHRVIAEPAKKELKTIEYKESEIIKPLFKAPQFLVLEPEILEQIGFRISKSELIFVTKKNDRSLEIHISEKANSVKIIMETNGEPSRYKLQALTGSKGQDFVKTTEGDLNDNQTLIPILLEASKYPINSDRLFWFEPTPEFLELIPEPMGSQIRQEYHYLIADNKEGLDTSCTFFEACHSTLHLHDLTVFPNPASSIVKVKFTLSEVLKGEITINTLTGIELINISPMDFQSGYCSFEFDVTDIPSGMYLLTFNTDKGFLTNRLIVVH